MENYLNNPNLKHAGVPIPFTKEQVEEYVRCSQDIGYFVRNYVKIIHVDRGRIPFEPYDFQSELLTKYKDNRNLIVRLPRQMGKTITTAAFLLWYILFNEQKVCGILANKAITAREILSRLKMSFEGLPLWLQQGVLEWNKGSIALENGSRVIAASTSSSAVRGWSFSVIFLDEFAHVHNNIAEEFFTSMFPTISSGKETKIIIASTPKGMNHYYKFWIDAEQGRNGFVPLFYPWNAHPERDEVWKEAQLKALGEVKFNQEVLCQFIGSSNTLISGEMLTKLQNSYKPPIRTEQNLAIYADPRPGRKYAMTCDVAHGIGQDATAASVFDVTSVPYQQVARYHNVYISPLLLPNILYEIGTAYNNALLLVEVNDIGNQVAEALHYELEYDNLIRTMPHRQQIKIGGGFKPRVLMGLRMTESAKKVGCANLKTLIESDKLIIHDFETISELTTFTQQLQTYKADEGYHDDIAMTLVTFAWMAAQRYFREEQTAVNMSKSMIDEQESDWLSFGFSTVLEDEKEAEAAPVEIGLSENGDRIIWREVNSEFF